MILLLLACSEPEPETTPPVVTTGPELVLPDLESADFPSVFEEALTRAATLDIRAPWAGHVASLAGFEPNCPDLYAGAPDTEAEVGDGGWSWADHCVVQNGDQYAGSMWWTNALAAEGDAETEDGQTLTGSRQMIGDATISGGDDSIDLLFDGEATDALTLIQAGDYERWTWSSEVRAAAEGSLVGDAWRADLYLYATGGEAETVELRGNVFQPDRLIADRFDSIAVDLSFAAPEATAPEGCALEPSGWVAVRDQDAFWYDLVLAPRSSDDTSADTFPNEPYSTCDGCGTLYVRGLPQLQTEVCLDFSFFWNDLLTHPDPEEFVLDVRTLPEEDSP